MIKIGRVEISDEKFQKELEIGQEKYANYSDSWIGNEALGRILYWMKEPSAKQYFEKAIEYRSPLLEKRGNHGREQLIIGNYHRLGGDLESANKFFQEAFEKLKLRVAGINDPRSRIDYQSLHSLIKVSFILKRYEDVILYGRVYHDEDPDPEILANALTSFTKAGLKGDSGPINAWLNNVEQRVKTIAGQGHFSVTGGVDGFDLYELVLDMLADIEE